MLAILLKPETTMSSFLSICRRMFDEFEPYRRLTLHFVQNFASLHAKVQLHSPSIADIDVLDVSRPLRLVHPSHQSFCSDKLQLDQLFQVQDNLLYSIKVLERSKTSTPGPQGSAEIAYLLTPGYSGSRGSLQLPPFNKLKIAE